MSVSQCYELQMKPYFPVLFSHEILLFSMEEIDQKNKRPTRHSQAPSRHKTSVVTTSIQSLVYFLVPNPVAQNMGILILPASQITFLSCNAFTLIPREFCSASQKTTSNQCNTVCKTHLQAHNTTGVHQPSQRHTTIIVYRFVNKGLQVAPFAQNLAQPLRSLWQLSIGDHNGCIAQSCVRVR